MTMPVTTQQVPPAPTPSPSLRKRKNSLMDTVEGINTTIASSDSERTAEGTPVGSRSRTGSVVSPNSTPSVARIKLNQKMSFERGGGVGAVEDEEDEDEKMDVDVLKSGIRFEQDEKIGGCSPEGRRESEIRESVQEQRRPSLPGIKQLFGIAGGATTSDSSRPSTPSFPGLSSLHGPLMSRSSISSVSSGRLSRFSSFASTSGMERESFSTSVGSGNINSPTASGWWRDEEERKGSYGVGSPADRVSIMRARDETDRRWSDLQGTLPQAEEVGRSSRFQSYPFGVASRVNAPITLNQPVSTQPISPRRSIPANGSSPLKWSTQPPALDHHGKSSTPVSPPWASGPRSAPLPFNDRSSAPAPSFVSPFTGAGLHHPQPLQIRPIPSHITPYTPTEANDRERARWTSTNHIGGHDPLSPRGSDPYPVQRSRSGQGSRTADRRSSSTSWRTHPYERDSQRSSLSSLSRQRSRSPGPVMGPYAEQARRGSVQIAPDMLHGGGAHHWKTVDPLVKMEDTRSSLGPLEDSGWSSGIPSRASISGAGAVAPMSSHSMEVGARLSPRSTSRAELPRRSSDDPTADPSAFELEMQEKRRKSDSETGWRETSQSHWSSDWDHQRPGPQQSYDSMPSVLRPALPPSKSAQQGQPPSAGPPHILQPPYPDYDSQLPMKSSERVGQYQPIRVYPVNGMPTADLPRPLSSNENGPQGPGEHGTILNGPNGPRYICNFCSKQFTRPSSLRIHTYSHTGERPYVCSWVNCGRSFSVQSNLKRHAKTHTLTQAASTPAVPVAGLDRLQHLEMSRRNSYDVAPSAQESGYSSSRGLPLDQPERTSGQPAGRMSLGSLMDDTHQSGTRALLPASEIKTEEEEDADEEDELADEVEQEIIKSAVPDEEVSHKGGE